MANLKKKKKIAKKR